MKFLAALLSVYIVFLAVAGTMKPVEPSVKMHCCQKMARMSAVQKKKMQEQHQNNDCEKQSCTLMFSCPLCGFVIAAPLNVQVHFITFIAKPVSHYKIGDLSAYHPSDWKPPKTC